MPTLPPTTAGRSGSRILIDRLPALDGVVWVAWSGGMDSTALLQAARQRYPADQLRAIHVNHGLHARAGDWAAHCAQLAQGWGIALTVEVIEDRCPQGESVEAWARDRRYAAFERVLGADEHVLLAHHADDQAETLLLRMTRGTGLAGLAGMPAQRPVGDGRLHRPWLDVPRSAVAAYARTQDLTWIDDPSNADPALDRSWLRHNVMPALAARWPAMVGHMAALAADVSEQRRLLDDVAAVDLARIKRADGSLSCSSLLAMDRVRACNAVRHHLTENGLDLPDRATLNRLFDEVCCARPHANPLLRWGGAEARRYREALYLSARLPESAAGQTPAVWAGAQLQFDCGRLIRDAADQRAWTVRSARVDDVVRQVGRPGKRWSRWCQEQGVAPWLRQRVPLVIAEGEAICAVGGRPVQPALAPSGLRWTCSLPGAASLAAESRP